MVGVNAFSMNEVSPIKTLRINESARNKQIERLREVKKLRDNASVQNALRHLRKSFDDSESNCIYPMLKAVKSYATLGEIVEVGREVFGEWKEPSIL
jgi:methylmalonyl-CoA mutase N-terminal domain/subunit